MRTAILVVAVAVTAAGCGHAAPDSPSEVRLDVDPGETFTVAPGQLARVRGADLTVRFLEVTQDSRCPEDVQCVWEGDAAVAVETVLGGVEQAWLLHTSGDPRIGSRAAEPDGFVVELVGLEPAPRSGTRIPPERYRAAFRVLAR